MRTHTHASVEICFTLRRDLSLASGGCPPFFLQDTTAREGLGLWASGRVAKLHAGFLFFFFSLPSILFITIINNTKLHSGITHCLQKETGSIGEKGEGNGHACLKAADSTTTTHQFKQSPCLLFSFVTLSTDRTSPGSSTHHIPAVYCKSNEKITIW